MVIIDPSDIWVYANIGSVALLNGLGSLHVGSLW